MNILIVVGTLSGYGGIETCVRTLAEEASAHGDRVRVLALTPSSQDESWHAGLDYAEVANGPKSLGKQMIRGLPAVAVECRARPPDVVVVIYSSSIPMVRVALLLAGLRRPVVAWLHFSMAHKQRTNLLRFADAHLAISSEIADSTRQLPGVAPESVHLVYNGVHLDDTAMLPRTTEGPLRLLQVGRLMMGRQKRTDELLRALARVDGQWQLDLVGAGDQVDDVPQLQALAVELGIGDRIRWHGRLADPWHAVEAADLLVLCSEFEGFPMVLIEAMARGVPCLSSDCPSGPADIVQPARNGWLFSKGDTGALVGWLQRLVRDRAQLPSAEEVRASVRTFGSRETFERIRLALGHAAAAFR